MWPTASPGCSGPTILTAHSSAASAWACCLVRLRRGGSAATDAGSVRRVRFGLRNRAFRKIRSRFLYPGLSPPAAIRPPFFSDRRHTRKAVRCRPCRVRYALVFSGPRDRPGDRISTGACLSRDSVFLPGPAGGASAAARIVANGTRKRSAEFRRCRLRNRRTFPSAGAFPERDGMYSGQVLGGTRTGYEGNPLFPYACLEERFCRGKRGIRPTFALFFRRSRKTVFGVTKGFCPTFPVLFHRNMFRIFVPKDRQCRREPGSTDFRCSSRRI